MFLKTTSIVKGPFKSGFVPLYHSLVTSLRNKTCNTNNYHISTGMALDCFCPTNKVCVIRQNVAYLQDV